MGNRYLSPMALFLYVALYGFVVVTLTLTPPPPEPVDADMSTFSAARAVAVMREILPGDQPHPVNSAENEALRARIIAEFTKLGLEPVTASDATCRGFRQFSVYACSNITNILVPIKEGSGIKKSPGIEEGSGKPIILMAHYDSVPAGAGAADDIHGVAVIHEVARAILRDPDFSNPVLALLTDGEESGLFGARAYFSDPENAEAAGVVINIEGRGNQGASLLFETGSDAGWLIDLFANHAERPVTNSLMQAAYKILPNDTDLSESLDAGVQGVNFAFAGNVAHYHTALDTVDNLSLSTLQHQGNNVLSMVNALKAADLANPPGGDALYIDILARFVIILPAWTTWPLILIAFGCLIWSAWSAPADRNMTAGRAAAAAALVPAVLLLAAAGGLAVAFLSGLFGEASPGYATPVPLRLAIYLTVGAVTLFVGTSMGKWLGPRTVFNSIWAWMSVFSILAAVFAPGAVIVFVLPMLAASAMSLFFNHERLCASSLGLIPLALTLLIWSPLVMLFEIMFGLAAPLILCVVSVFAALALMPFFTHWATTTDRAWPATGVVVLLAAASALYAGLLPSFDGDAPLRMNISHITDGRDGSIEWRVSSAAGGYIPDTVKGAADFSETVKPGIPLLLPRGLAAEAAPDDGIIPRLDFAIESDGDGLKVVRLAVQDAPRDARIAIMIPRAAKPLDVTMAGGVGRFDFIDEGTFQNYHIVSCAAAACGDIKVRLTADTATTWILASERRGLPKAGDMLKDARPDWAVPYQGGDVTINISEITI